MGALDDITGIAPLRTPADSKWTPKRNTRTTDAANKNPLSSKYHPTQTKIVGTKKYIKDGMANSP